MIQRKQTVYLLLAFVAMLVGAIVPTGLPLLWLIAAVAALGSIGNIFLFNNRPLQAKLCVGLLVLGLAYYIAVAVMHHANGGTTTFTWPMALPLVAMLFWFLAYKGINADEKLVRSLDRIR